MHILLTAAWMKIATISTRDTSVGDKNALITALKAAGAATDVIRVRKIHDIALHFGLVPSDIFVANTIITMYAKCGSTNEAHHLFRSLPARDVVSWNALITAYTQTRQCSSKALEIVEEFFQRGECRPSSRTYVAAAKACAGLAAHEPATSLGRSLVKVVCLERGMALHSRAASDGFQWDIYVATTMIDLYAKCGSLIDARKIFDGMPERNAVAWTALLSGYAENADGGTALEILELFLRRYPVDGRSLVAAAKACGSVAEKEKATLLDRKFVKVLSLERAMAIGSIAGALAMDPFVASSFVDMYSKCGSMEEACRVFDAIPSSGRDVVLWTSLIQGYAADGELELALEVFASVIEFHGCNSQTFVAALKACSRMASLEQSIELDGKIVKRKSFERTLCLHREAAERGFSRSDVHVVSSLIDLYAKCGSMDDSQAVFDRASTLNIVSWNALILGYGENEEDTKALDLFDKFVQCHPGEADSWTIVAVLTACSSLASKEKLDANTGTKVVALERAMAAHSIGCQSSIYVASSLIDTYSKCGSMVDARRVFDATPRSARDIVLWTTLLLGYAENGDAEAALELFQRMKREGYQLDDRVLAAAAKACAVCSDLQSGNEVYEEICRRGAEMHTLVIGCLIDLYGKCGRVSIARYVFDCSGPSGTATWNALIRGLCSSRKQR